MNLSLSPLRSEAGLAVEGLFILKDSLSRCALEDLDKGVAVDGRARVREDDCGLIRPGGKLMSVCWKLKAGVKLGLLRERIILWNKK